MDFGNGTWFDRVKNKGAVGGRETYDYNQYLQWGGKSLDQPSPASRQGSSSIAPPADAGKYAYGGPNTAAGFLSAYKKQQEDMMAKQKADQAALLERQRLEQEAKLAGQKSEEQAYLDKYGATLAGQETMSAMAGRIGSELGLPDLQANASALSATLRNIPKVQEGATRGFDVNANQLSRIVASEQGKIAPAAQEAVTQAQTAQTQLGTRLGYGLQDQQKALQPLMQEGTMMEQRFGRETTALSDRIAREFTGFSTGQQNELTSLLNVMQTDTQLTMQEIQRVNELAKAETEFQRQKELYAQQLADQQAATEKQYAQQREMQTLAQQAQESQARTAQEAQRQRDAELQRYNLEQIGAQNAADIGKYNATTGKNTGSGTGNAVSYILPGINTPQASGTYSSKPVISPTTKANTNLTVSYWR